MHPPLAPAKHPLCLDVIEALQACHACNPLKKLLGVCNQQKWDLDACFRAEKQVKRKANFEKAARERERLAVRKAAAS